MRTVEYNGLSLSYRLNIHITIVEYYLIHPINDINNIHSKQIGLEYTGRSPQDLASPYQ